jgi:L-fuculose-phosphate aldolase
MVEAMRRMLDLGLSQGTSGNLSVRTGSGFLVTPSGIPAEQLSPDDLVPMDFDGHWDHPLAPSSEWRFHRDILAARPEIGAVVHAHPPYATGFAICGREIPAVHYMIAMAGGPTIRCAPYAPYGTQRLSDFALDALEGRSACLLANHGMIATGPNLSKAMQSPCRSAHQSCCPMPRSPRRSSDSSPMARARNPDIELVHPAISIGTDAR